LPNAAEIAAMIGTEVSPWTIRRGVARHVLGRTLTRTEILDETTSVMLQLHYFNHRVHHPRMAARTANWPVNYNTTFYNWNTPRERTSGYLGNLPHSSSPSYIEETEIGIGCDPEFEMHDGSRFLRWVTGSQTSQLGMDGDGATGELRPRWSHNPIEVYNRIDTLLTEVRETAGDNLIGAGGGTYRPTGGHIHISGIGMNPNSQVISALDTFIYYPLNDRCAGVRRSTGYNRPGEIRPQRMHGGFEYRSAPSWLAHPILTKGSLVIAAIITRNHQALPQNREELADKAHNADERSAVESFYAFLDSMTTAGRTLESLEVLRQWGKRKVIATVPTPRLHRARVSNDQYMPTEAIMVPSSGQGELLFVGASETPERRGRNIIFLNSARFGNGISREDIFTIFRDTIVTRHSVSIIYWDKPYIGFSMNLREQASTAQLTAIIQLISMRHSNA
jgi:hypothetical protein